MKHFASFTKHITTAALMASMTFPVSMIWASEVENAIDYRQGLMNVFSWNMKAMSKMMKGKVPFDQKVFAKHAHDLAIATMLDLLPGFPEDSESELSDARPEIWMEFDDFEAKYKELGLAAGKLSEAATTGDKTSLGKALEITGKACKACHEKYKN